MSKKEKLKSAVNVLLNTLGAITQKEKDQLNSLIDSNEKEAERQIKRAFDEHNKGLKKLTGLDAATTVKMIKQSK